jgi:hypothetical protein
MSIATEFAAQAAALIIWRAANPKARRNRATAIVHNGGTKTVFGCVCGAKHSTSTDWNGRNAKHVEDWRGEHDDCIVEAVVEMRQVSA